MTHWQPQRWQHCLTHYQPIYPDQAHVQAVIAALEQAAPMVSAQSIENCLYQLASVYHGNLFILQAGDCAESFDTPASYTRNMAQFIDSTANLLQSRLKRPLICIGRIAGQFAKPRSRLTESRQDVTLPSYQGDLINTVAFNRQARTPQANRLWRGYQCAQTIMREIAKCQLVHPFFTSHEALHLSYETTQTRLIGEHRYNLATHQPWIGMRTNHPDQGHVHYLAGLRNPIAVKLGPDHTEDMVECLVQRLNAENQPGRLTLITRLGVDRVEQVLPQYIAAVKRSQRKVLWLCDPMHGNSFTTSNGYKTRQLDDIAKEIATTQAVLGHHQLSLHGLHLELTWQPVTECLDTQTPPSCSAELAQHYHSLMDPRLNPTQTRRLLTNITAEA